MGYTTSFEGRFNLDRPLTEELFVYLNKFSETRRMARRLGPKFGIEGEFFVGGTGDCGQDRNPDIINYNEPPSTQPGLWCQWVPTEDRMGLEWNGTEKFYNYKEWLGYVTRKFLNPLGYTVSGSVTWQGEEDDDKGILDAPANQDILQMPIPEYMQIGAGE